MGDSAVLPLSGDVAAIRSSADGWLLFAGAAETAAGDVRRLDSGDFRGDEADLYRERLNHDLPPHLDTTSQAWSAVSSALQTYATSLESLQQRMSAVSSQAADQQTQVAAANGAAADARTADGRHSASVEAAQQALKPGEKLPPDTYQPQTGAAAGQLAAANAALQATTDAANRLHSEHAAAVDRCVGAIDAAAGLRFEEPPGFWGRLGAAVGGWIRDHADVLKAISGVLKQISNIAGILAMIPILAPVMAPLAAATAAGAVVIDSAVMVATGEGSLMDIGMDALGALPGGGAASGVAKGAKMAEEAHAAVGLAKTGTAVGKDAKGLGTAASDVHAADGAVAGADRAEGAVAGADRSGGRAVDSADSAVAHDTPVDDLPCVGDPIDVVTGEMVLQQTDLALPGVLPLVLKRVYKSGYSWGGRFGRSWASTLDQRVEVGAGGAVCFVAEDGVVLHYSTDGSADEVLPSEGIQRWPLRREAGGGWSVEDPDRRVTRRFGAPDGQGCCALLEIADAHGNSIAFQYGDRGMVSEIVHSGGYRVLVASADGLVTGVSVHNGAEDAPVATFGYDQQAQLVAVHNAGGSPLTLQWESGRIVGWRDRNDIWYRYDYDESGRCVRTAGRGRVLSYGFSYLPGRTLVTDSLGGISTYEYNAAHQVTRTVDPLGSVTASVWDRYDRLLVRTDPLGRSTQFDYDGAGRLVEVIRPDGVRETLRRNARGDVVELVDGSGAVWSYTYDDAGRATSTRDPSGAVTTRTFAATGAVGSVTDPLGAVTTAACNSAGLPVSVSDPLGATIAVDYDAFGRAVRCVDPLGGVTSFGWTPDGHPAHRVGPDGALKEWTWDQEGNLTSFVEADGARTAIENGVFDLPVARTGPDGGRMVFGYDTELRLTSVQNPAGLRWRYEYDAAGRLVGETDFNGRTQRYRHDAAGQLIGMVNGLGQETSFAYDAAGNLVERTTPDGATRLGYDEAGRLVTVHSPGARVGLVRDARGRVVQETVNGRSLTVGFDAVGRRVSRHTPAGVLSQWQFDAAGRPTSLAIGGEQVTFEHDLGGREIARVFAAGGRLEQRFDRADRLVSQLMSVTDVEGAAPVIGRAFDYRVDGVLAGVVDSVTGASRRIEVDVAGRVVGVSAAGWTEGYAYDRSGRVSLDSSGVPAGVDAPACRDKSGGTRAYDGTLVTRAGNMTYGHDRQGRVVTRTRRRLSQRPENWQFRYDADDRMIEAVSDGQHWSYTYDAFGRRISKQRLGVGGEVVEQTMFTWDGNRLIEQARTTGPGSDATVTTWEYAPDSWTPITQTVTAGGGAAGVDAEFYAIVSDLVGAPTELVTADGRQVAWANADANVWGAPRQKAANGSGKHGRERVDCPIRFPGQYADDETGLHYNRHRYYDPASARYTTADPLGLAPADDPHGYVLNPTGWADPLGLTPCDPANLLGHEANGGHTIEKHVGKSDDYLRSRQIEQASTFPDLATASQETANNLMSNAGAVTSWLREPRSPRLRLYGSLTAGAGRTFVQATNSFAESTHMLTVLKKVESSSVGYRIVTSHPRI